MAYAPGAVAPAARPNELAKPAAISFTKVGERAEETRTLGDLVAGALAPQTIALLAGLVFLLAGGWYVMRPESADAQFARIEAAASSDDADAMKAARRQMASFLESYPDDPRAEQVRAYSEQAEQSSPIQRAMADAKRQALTNPDVALARYQAIIDVYDEGSQNSEATARHLKLAELQIARLRPNVEKNVADGKALITARLQKADELASTDAAAARRIYRGVIELYHNRPWAHELVERARMGQRKLSQP
jgi:hypothetical protein